MAEISALKTQKIVVVPSYLQLIHLSGLEKKNSWILEDDTKLLQTSGSPQFQLLCVCMVEG